MGIFCEIGDLSNESDVEQKLIYPLMTSGIGLKYFPEELKTKDYLAPTDIDKGAGKSTGYYPDYGIVLMSLISVIVEAKSPTEDVAGGFREGQLYAHEINKRFSQGLNPAYLVISCNGHKILYGAWDSEDFEELEFDALVPGARAFEAFRDRCGRKRSLANAKELRGKLSPGRRFKPLKFLGGPSRQNAELPPNEFSDELVPLLTRYFDPDSAHLNPEFLEKAYVATREVTKYNSLLEALLKDNLEPFRHPEVQHVSTSKTEAPEVDDAIRKLIDDGSTGKQPLLLLLGNVGAGKSLFLNRYEHSLMPKDISERTLWAVIDLNSATDNLEHVTDWIVKQVIEDLPRRNGIADFYSLNMLRRYFAPKIKKRDEGAYADIKKNQTEEYERRIADDLAAWQDDQEEFFRGVARYFMGDKGLKLVIVFDNADRRDAEQQLSIFQEVQHFRAEYKCFCILSLRDETYDRFRNEPPLDAFFKPFAIRITAPRFADVIKKRLNLAIEELTANAPGVLKYVLPNEMEVQYPSTGIGKYLFGVYLSLFKPNRALRVILESLSGRDVRYALQIFCDILMSGYMREDLIFKAHYDASETHLPEWLVVRTLMRTKYKYYGESHGYVVNLFSVDENSDSTSNFLLVDILSILCRDRKKQGPLGIEGYCYASTMLEELSRCGYLREDVLWGMDLLLKARLISADHQRTSGVGETDYVKVTASGYCHLNTLLNRQEYLCNVCLDTWFRDQAAAKKMADSPDDILSHHKTRLSALLEAMGLESQRYLAQSLTNLGFKTGPEWVLPAIEDNIERMKQPKPQSRGKQGENLTLDIDN